MIRVEFEYTMWSHEVGIERGFRSATLGQRNKVCNSYDIERDKLMYEMELSHMCFSITI